MGVYNLLCYLFQNYRLQLLTIMLSMCWIVMLCLLTEIWAWTEQEDIRTGRVVMITGTSFTSSTPRISYNITYTSAISVGPTANAGLGITGLDTLVTNDLAVNLTIERFTLTEMRITASVLGDTICTHLAVNYIATGYNATTFCEVQFDCLLMSVINSGTGSRSEFRTGQTYLSALTLNVTVHLAGFHIHNSQGINNYLAATATIPSGSSTINYAFTTAQNNTVSHICLTTVIFCQSCTKIEYFYWGLSYRGGISNTVQPQTVMDPDARYQDLDRMFFGMSALNLSRAFNRSFDLDTTQYNNLDTNYQSNHGMYSIMMDYFWIVKRSCGTGTEMFEVATQTCINRNSCPNGPNGDSLETTAPLDFCTADCYYTCETCDGSMPNNCSTCNSTKFRVDNSGVCECSSGYIDIGINYRQELCYPCQYFIPGCNTCFSTILCQTCLQGYILNTNGTCSCTSGYLVSGVCTNITGCTSAIEYGGTVYCIACNDTLHYTRSVSEYSCICSTGYVINSFQTCVSVCGDGIQVSTQACDDGNTVDGDGCSQTCTIQTNYTCINGSLTSPSVCLISDTFSMSVKYVRRLLSNNTMRVGIQISPTYSNLTQVNFKKYLTHNIPSTNYNATYIDGLLILDFLYTETIEGNSYSVSMSLDPNTFHNANMSVAIPASGMNAKLTYDTLNDSNSPLEIVVIALDVIAIIVMVVAAVLSEKMIGIQCIQVLQTVLFLQAALPVAPSTLAPLQNLRFSSGYNQIFGIDYSRTYPLTFSLSSIGLQKQFILSVNLMYIVLIVIVVLALIVKLLQKMAVNEVEKAVDNEGQQQALEKYVKLTKVFNFIFQKFVFVFGFLLMFLVVFAMMIQSSSMSGSYSLISTQFNLLSGVVAVGIIGGLIGLICVNSIFPSTKIFPIWTKQWYPMIYFLYQTLFITLLAFIYTQSYILYIMIALTFCFLIFNLIYRPYFYKFHNIALAFNQLIILVAEGVYLYEYLLREENQTFFKIIVWVITILLYIVVAITIYRIVDYRGFINQALEEGGHGLFEDEPTFYNQAKNHQIQDFKKYPSTNRSRKPKDVQLTNLKKSNLDSKITKHKDSDGSPKKYKGYEEFQWNYNQLADQKPDPSKVDKDRIPSTKRQQNLNTSLEKPIIRDEDSFNNDQNTSRAYKNSGQPYNKYADEEPYSLQAQELEEDPLALIKKKLKKDFNSKLHGTSKMITK